MSLKEVGARAARPRARRRSFLSDVVVEHGPRNVVNRVVLRADTELRALGVSVSFASFGELVDVNRRHADSWRPILPLYDPDIGGIDESNGFAILGYDAAGEVVYAQASRVYDLGEHTLQDEIESLRLFYADPERSRGPGEAMRCSVPSAGRVRGKAVFVGAVWYRPDYRKKNLMQATTPLVRALSFTRWQSDFVFSFMAEDLVRSGTAAKGRFPHVEWEVSMVRTPVHRDGTLRAAIVWTNAGEQLRHFDEYLASPLDPEVNLVVEQGAA